MLFLGPWHIALCHVGKFTLWITKQYAHHYKQCEEHPPWTRNKTLGRSVAFSQDDSTMIFYTVLGCGSYAPV